MISFRQWDVVRVRLRPEDRDEHFCIVISPEEICANERKPLVNILAGSAKRPAQTAAPHEIPLNGADGLERLTLFIAPISARFAGRRSPLSPARSPLNTAGRSAISSSPPTACRFELLPRPGLERCDAGRLAPTYTGLAENQ